MRANVIKRGIVRAHTVSCIIRYHYFIHIAETVQTGNRNRVAAEIIQIYVTLICRGA